MQQGLLVFSPDQTDQFELPRKEDPAELDRSEEEVLRGPLDHPRLEAPLNQAVPEPAFHGQQLRGMLAPQDFPEPGGKGGIRGHGHTDSPEINR